jgi:branched-chain amino acid transport system substrate-binding protein
LLSQAMAGKGVSAPMVGGDGLYDHGFITKKGQNGTTCTSAGYPVAQLPDGGAFVAAYAAMFPGSVNTDYDAYSYDSAQVIINAVVGQAEASGTAMVGTVPGKRGIIARVSATDMTGATGHISFDATGERRDPMYALFKVVGGAWAFQHMIAPPD